MLDEFNLEGHVALVTGGGRGIGRIIALTLAEAGADVAVASRTFSQLESVAVEITQSGRKSLALEVDITDSIAIDSMVERVTRQFGRIDILVNNAGIAGAESVISSNDAQWDQIMRTNLSGPFYCCRAVGRQMLDRRSGRVINISSNYAAIASANHAAYNSSKAGLNMLTKVLSVEWAPYNVGVNAIGPGWFETDMTRGSLQTKDDRDKVAGNIPMKRLTNLRDLGLLAVYLASPASSWMTGQVIYLDGGETGTFL